MRVVPRLNPFVCPDCALWVREVESTWGEILLLNAARDPLGRVVPWPSDRENGQTQARLLPAGVPAENEDTWSVHSCSGVVGCGLFACLHLQVRLHFVFSQEAPRLGSHGDSRFSSIDAADSSGHFRWAAMVQPRNS